MSEWKGCPFCGEKVVDKEYAYYGKRKKVAVRVQCPGCETEFRVYASVDDAESIYEAVANKWNQRR